MTRTKDRLAKAGDGGVLEASQAEGCGDFDALFAGLNRDLTIVTWMLHVLVAMASVCVFCLVRLAFFPA